MEIKSNSFQPVFRQLADYMYNEIVSGNWVKGEKLPPEPELAEKLNTTRPTLRKALRILIERGMISQVKGQGTFVTHSSKTSGKKRRVGIICNRRKGNVMSDIYLSSVIFGVETAFSDAFADYELLILQRDMDKGIVSQCKDDQLDAVIDIAGYSEAYFSEQINSFPHALLDCSYTRAKNADCVTVSIDYQGSYRQQLERLIALGHRDIAVLVASTNDMEIIETTFREKHLPIRPPLIVPKEQMDEPGVARFVDQMLKERRPTAFFFCSYTMACAGYKHLKKLGIKIPEEISVAGVGNYQRFFGGGDVEFMSIEQPIREMGETAGRMLLAQLAGATMPKRQIVLKCELLNKPTTAPAAAAIPV